MNKRPPSILAAILAVAVGAAPIAARSAERCDLQVSFARPDEQGTHKVNVYEGNADPSLKGAKPLAFISDLKVNTDGTRISYKVDDPRAKNGAINNILNAMHKGHTIAEFEDLAKNDWQPLPKTWQVLLNNVIEKDKKTGKPCVGANNFLVSLARMLARGFERVALYLLKPFQRDLKNHRAEIIDIRERLDRVEKKIGIGK